MIYVIRAYGLFYYSKMVCILRNTLLSFYLVRLILHEPLKGKVV